MTVVLFSVAALGVIAIIFGAALGYAGIKFKVEEDPKLAELHGHLPGANCGGCGHTGCWNWMQAVYDGTEKPEACGVLSADALKEIGRIMDIEVTPPEQKKSFVCCIGDDTNSGFRYEYRGAGGCAAMMRLAGGGCKACGYGCLGGGSCVTACKFGAITIINGIAATDPDKCTSCGICETICPKKNIKMIPAGAKIFVACSSKENARAVRIACDIGCIGCKLCEKICKFGAIRVADNLAEIDYSKCTGCGTCAESCPRGVIKKGPS